MSDFPLIENPSKLKVAELKEELDKRGLPVGGLKKDLVARLEESQGLTQPPVPDEAKYEPDPALPEHKAIGNDEDHAKPADSMADLAVPPHEISNTNEPAISSDVIDPEVAAAHYPDQAAPPTPPPLHESKSDESDGKKVKKEGEEAVGHVMVEGEETVDAEEQASIQPAALDSEVAKVVAEEEMKDSNPSPIEPNSTSMSMEKHISESRVHTPDLDQDEDEDVLDLGEEVESKKRMRDDNIEKAPKRPKRQFRELPQELSHLIHPPTTCLYISNLRRPLLLSTLHEYLTPSENQSPLLPPSKAPFSNPEYPNIWLDGIKSHAYAVYDTVESAIEIAKSIDGKIFPEDTGGELKVEFIDEDEITRLVKREEEAWGNGRQKLELKITKIDGEGSGYKFEFSGGSTNTNGNGGGRPINGRTQQLPPPPPPNGRRIPVAVPLTGINAMPVGNRLQQGGQGGQGGRLQGQGHDGSRYPGPGNGNGRGGMMGGPQGQGHGGRDGRGLPPHLENRQSGGQGFRPGPGGFSNDRSAPGGGGGGFRSSGPAEGERRTRVKPELTWREGPRAR